MSETVSFGEWVQARRRQLRFTRPGLAREIGCSPVTIKKIERDERRPSVKMAELLAQYLQIPPSQQENFIRLARGEFVPRFGELVEMAEAQHPVRKAEVPIHNLPSPTTPFIGRELELLQIAEYLADPECRLLTILGAGGMGKTRLSIEAARAQTTRFANGVVFVPLVPAGDTDQPVAGALNPLVSALVDSLKIEFQGREPPEIQVVNYLRRQEMLIVFDDFDLLLSTAVFLSDILGQAQGLKILTTSRERLNLEEERLFVLEGLPFAYEEGTAPSEELGAVQLFTQRAQQVKADFDWSAQETAVLRICQLVEGMPLGLELAAAWVLQLSCQEIADEIEASLDLLKTEMRNIPDRHRSIRAVFNNSWQLLTTEEKDVLGKLSVFRSGFDRHAVWAVAGASLPTLARLVGKSMLTVKENGRYAMHELLRQFAGEKLAEHEADVLAARRLHCRYFLVLMAEQEPKIRGPEFLELVAVIEIDLDNVRTAVQWGINHEPQLFSWEVGFILWVFYGARALYLESEHVFSSIVSSLKRNLDLNQFDNQADGVSPEQILWAQYNTILGANKGRLGHLEEAEGLLQRSLSLLPASSSMAHWTRAYCLAELGRIVLHRGNPSQAMTYLQESSTLVQKTGDPWLFAFVLFLQGTVERVFGNYDEAQRLLEESERLLSQIEDQRVIGFVLDMLGSLAISRGDLVKAEIYSQEALARKTKLGSFLGITESLNRLGRVAYLKGEYQKAHGYLEQCLQIATEKNSPIGLERSLWNLGNLAVAEGNYELAKEYFAQVNSTANVILAPIGGPGWAALGLGETLEARHYFQTSLRVMLKGGSDQAGLDALVGIAQLKLHDNQLSQALELLALVEHHPGTYWEVQEKAQKLWQEVVVEIPPDLVAQAETRGRELDLRETAEALLAEWDKD